MLRYPKAYGTITTVLDNATVTVKMDSGEQFTLKGGYVGGRRDKMHSGRRIKLYQRPQDRRGYCWKLTGE